MIDELAHAGPDAGEIFRDWFDNAAADPADGYTGEDYAEHIRTEFSTFRWLLEPMLAAAGFEILTVDFERHLYGAYTCIKRSARQSPAPRSRGMDRPG